MPRPLILLLVALLAVQVLPTLGSRDLWAFDEVRHAAVLRGVLQDGDWLSLRLNGEPYPDKPPLYFWIVAAVASLLGEVGLDAFVLVSGAGGFALALVTAQVARACGEGGSPTPAARPPLDFGGLCALALIATPLYQVLLRTTRMDLLFSALSGGAAVLLFQGLRQDAARVRLLSFAGGLAGLAVLVKGPLGAVLPFVAAGSWVVWHGRTRRLARLDVLLALTCAVFPAAVWLLAVAGVEGWGYVERLFGGQVLGRAIAARRHAQPVWFYVPCLAGALLPWTLAAPPRTWLGWLSPSAWRRRWAERHAMTDGRAFLVVWAVSNFVVLSLLSSKLFIYLMPMLVPLVVLAVDAVRSAPDRVRGFVRAAGVALVAVGLGTAGLPWADLPVSLPPMGVAATSALALVLGLGFAWRPPSSARALGGLALGGHAIYLLITLTLVPPFNAVMSPRPIAERLAALEDRGYAPLVFDTYPGTYTFHAGRDLPESRDPKALVRHAGLARAVIAMPSRAWRRHAGRLTGFSRITEQRIEGRPFVLLARPAPPEAAR